ncbi:hypothetical protein H2203_007957 [Taxawa tesnikishii (nom. ined.)]|nr:hypothetical protein H2203_007957 [Dothideales sp. JES 119]
MARYQGWDFDEMKRLAEEATPPSSQHEALTAAPSGFNPINKRQGTGINNDPAAGLDSNLSDCTTQCRSNHSNAIVADYLGLNAEQDPEFPRSLAAHNPSEKKRAVAGKSQNSKGTKTANSIRERRAKTKPTAKASAPEDDSAARSSVYSDDPQHAVDAAGTIPVLDAMAPTESTVSQGTKRKRDAFKYNTTEGHPDRSSVAVVAPQTSLHTVRASQSFGISVYNNERRKSPRESIVQYSQPFLIRSIRDNEENLDSSGQMYEINQDSGTGNPSTEPKEGKARLGVGANTDLPNVDNAVLLLDEELLQDDPITDIDENDLLEMCIALEVNPSGNDERPSHVNGQLPTPLNSDWIAEPNPMDDNAGRLLSSGPDTILNEDEEWCTLDDEDDAEMLSLIETAEERARLSASPSEDTERSNRTRREKSKNMRTVEPTEMTYPFLDHRRKRNSPEEKTSNDPARKCIVRKSFPEQIKDRSPVIGASANNLLRTCFRIGEALNTGCQAVRVGRSMTIELYARVVSSCREPEGVKQHFVFADLFHDRPPHLTGVYEIWKGVDLWDYDSGRFLMAQEGGRLCRCVGKMSREGQGWKLTVLNIWEATWEDVEYAAGIYCA